MTCELNIESNVLLLVFSQTMSRDECQKTLYFTNCTTVNYNDILWYNFDSQWLFASELFDIVTVQNQLSSSLVVSNSKEGPLQIFYDKSMHHTLATYRNKLFNPFPFHTDWRYESNHLPDCSLSIVILVASCSFAADPILLWLTKPFYHRCFILLAVCFAVIACSITFSFFPVAFSSSKY